LLDSAIVLDPRLASAWFWKARLIGVTSFYLKQHRMETLAMIQPDNERALPPAARAVELAPDRPIYRELYESLLQATGRTDEEYRAHPLTDSPWGGKGTLAGLDEDWSQVPVPAGAVELSSNDLFGSANTVSGSSERRVIRNRTYAFPGTAAELERHFESVWTGFAWKQVTAQDFAADPLAAMLAPAPSDSVKMFQANLEWTVERGRKVLRLPWGTGPDDSWESMNLFVIELWGQAGGTRSGPLESIRTNPYCLLTLANRRALSR
jgi:hypothetical protein